LVAVFARNGTRANRHVTCGKSDLSFFSLKKKQSHPFQLSTPKITVMMRGIFSQLKNVLGTKKKKPVPASRIG
jgi:hypothetical protein